MDKPDGEIRGNDMLTGEDGPIVQFIARACPSTGPVKHDFQG